MAASRRQIHTTEMSDIGRRRMERRMAGGRRSDQRWKDILDGAAAAFRDLGYAATTLNDVAGRVGVNRASLYYYVGTKQELLISLLHRPLLQMTANAKAIVALELPAEETLVRILRRWIRDMDETPELMLFLSESIPRVLTGWEGEELSANAAEYTSLLTAVIAAGMDRGELRRDVEPGIAMRAILGMFTSIHEWYRPDGPHSLVEIGSSFTELALASLRPR